MTAIGDIELEAQPSDLTKESDHQPSAPIASWGWVASSSRRENALEGLLYGCAIGEGLAMARDGYSRRQALKVFGRTPIQFRFIPGVGVSDERLHSVLMTIQSILESRADHRTFVRKLRRRRRWYLLSAPVRWLFRACQPRINFSSQSVPMPKSLAGDPLPRAAAISLTIQGSQHAYSWVEGSTRITTKQTGATEAAMLVANAMQLAQMLDPNDKPFTSLQALETLIGSTDEGKLRTMLVSLSPMLEKRYSVARAARAMGWGNGIPNDLRAIAVMGVYAWLRHPFRFRFAVERAVLLGGACSATAAIAGALSGAALGTRRIPREWLSRVSMFPHDDIWREGLIHRVKDWPHGVEDIRNAHAEQTYLLGQLGRNWLYALFRLIHLAIRLPARLTPYRSRKR